MCSFCTPTRAAPDPPFIKEKIEKNLSFTKKTLFEVNILCKKINLVLTFSENPFAFDVFYSTK